MMLTPEQLAELRAGNIKTASMIGLTAELVAHIDAQQARIAELEENAGAHALAMKAGKAMLEAETARADSAEKDAARYRQLRRGQQWSVIDSIGDVLRAYDLDAAIDAAMQPTWPEDTSDYGSRIAVVGQNGNDGLHYGEGKP